MLLKLICIVQAICLVNCLPYLVSLKTPASMEALLNYDFPIVLNHKIRSWIENTYEIGTFKGFSCNLPSQLIEVLRKCPLIADISLDITFHALNVQMQAQAPRHLARLSCRDSLEDELSYFYNEAYAGNNVNAYIIDSGIDIEHPEFEGRAKRGKDFTKEGFGDNNGHGTHVAGIIGSKTYGVAKKVDMYEIKALDRKGSGSLSTIIAAIEYTVNHRISSGRYGIANLSLGALRNKVLNKAIEAAIDTGLVIVVAAGNSNINACLTSPASAKSAITVGAIDDYSDKLASFSNWGNCVDIFASGTYVESVNAHVHEKPQILSGTSMSTPVIAGLVANLLSQGIPPQNIKETLIELSTKGKIPRRSLFLRGKTPNRIAYSGIEPAKLNEYKDDDIYNSDEEEIV